MSLSPVQRKFCESVRSEYGARYAVPCRLPDAEILRLALSYKFLRADDSEIYVLLDDMHGTNSGADLAHLDIISPNPRSK